MPSRPSLARTIAFQGALGANSHIAINEVYPDYTPVPCTTFDDAFQAVKSGRASLGMIPIDNSLAGRVADIHHLLPESGLYIVGEHYLPVRHQLVAPPGASLKTIKRVYSHVHALAQCRKIIKELGLKAIVHADTAGAAAEIAQRGDPEEAALSPALAARIYGLKILKKNVEDGAGNTTRFVIMSKHRSDPAPGARPCKMAIVFRVRSIPAALYKALGGFATNGVNVSKLESYMIDAQFTVAQFFAEIEGHPSDHNVELALEELQHFSTYFKILGVYPKSKLRNQR
jgi:prephenate dehydratase